MTLDNSSEELLKIEDGKEDYKFIVGSGVIASLVQLVVVFW